MFYYYDAGKHKRSSTVLMIVQRVNERQVHVITLLVCTQLFFSFTIDIICHRYTFSLQHRTVVSNHNSYWKLFCVSHYIWMPASSSCRQYLWVFYYLQIYTYKCIQMQSGCNTLFICNLYAYNWTPEILMNKKVHPDCDRIEGVRLRHNTVLF